MQNHKTNKNKEIEYYMNLDNKKIGIWGFGVVGKAALHYFRTYNIYPTVMDAKKLSLEEQELLESSQSTFISQKNCDEFLTNNDFILASPGIDLRPFTSYRHKFITELDLFTQNTNKKIIAITGTIGKTTITHILSKILARNKKVATGGNIGTGMLELIQHQEHIEMNILELSSFQLEYCQKFAPDLAIWTNLFPNHLDRHTTFDDYFDAKYSILAHQKENQQALVPLELAPKIMHKNAHNKKYKGTLHFFSSQQPCLHKLDWLTPESNLFWLEDEEIIHFNNHRTKKIGSLNALSDDTFAINWLIVAASLYLLNEPISFESIIEIPEHRMEKVATCNSIDFYNDSKATIMESTIAAVEKLQAKPIILILGGLSKGVDRKSYLKQIQGKVKYIVSFGKESEILAKNAQENNLPSKSHATLDEAFTSALSLAQPNNQILLSPGGSSYDLYTDYKQRGEHFKKLIHNLINS